MKILVTGANGYLGKGIVKQLCDEGNEVIAACHCGNGLDDRAVIKECDIFDVINPYDYFEQPDVLLHLAWKDGFVHNSEEHIKNLPKHFEFIKKLCQSGIKKVSVMGTMHEVGFFEGEINENTPCNPMTLYGISKNALKSSLEIITKQTNTEFQWLRAYYIVGNSIYGNSIFSKITAAAQSGKKEFPFTTGKNQYDFLDYEDFCKEVAATIEQSEIDGIINICSGNPESLASRVERFIKENNYDIRLIYGAFPDRPYDSKGIWGDNSKITEIMNNQNQKIKR